MAIQLKLGLEVIRSYRRLSYTPWHAIAEFVDNATQSYANHRNELDHALSSESEQLTIGVVYDRDSGVLRVSDNAMGMSFEELEKALVVGIPPADTSGRSKYGMGMKTAACWIGNTWKVRTKRLGETQQHTVTIDVEQVATANNDIPHQISETNPGDHYTVIEIYDHNRAFHGRTLGKIRQFLQSMYRQDLRKGLIVIEWQGSRLEWNDSNFRFLTAPDGSVYKREFEFDVGGKKVHGWVGILERGSRANAGFSILHADRVVRGWPDSWRPESLYGQIQGSNDLVNQRLIGEIHLDRFEVSHTKDDILWFGDEEEKVQRLLRDHCGEYAEVARRHRSRTDDQRGPSEVETTTAVDELVRELSSPELVDAIRLSRVPPPETVLEVFRPIKDAVRDRESTYTAESGDLEILGFLMEDASPNDPYVVVDSTDRARVLITINVRHPHWLQLNGAEGVLNYLRHCTFDGIAEWLARIQSASLDPDTIKVLKDRLLRIPLEIEMHQAQTDQDLLARSIAGTS